MENDYTRIMIDLWSQAAADAGRPSCRVEDGCFVLQIRGNRGDWAAMVKAAGVPTTADQAEGGDTLTCRWPSYADEIFGPGGTLAQAMPGYESRAPQLHMARLVQRAIEMRLPAAIEAGTGTGKSLAYAAIAMRMGRRVVISTSNKALQMQLYRKDVPFLQTIFPGKKMVLVQGKQNYLCRAKVEDSASGTYRLRGELLDWYLSTPSGNTEEIPFRADADDLHAVTVDAYCAGKQCARYGDCFYFEAKRARAEADVLICNHMLLALHTLYPGAGILPPVDVVVVDEAHQYANYVRNAVGTSLPAMQVRKRLELAARYGVLDGAPLAHARAFETELLARFGSQAERQAAVPADMVMAATAAMADTLRAAADAIWPEGQLPETPQERHLRTDANQLRATADGLRFFAAPPPAPFVRWVELDDGSPAAVAMPHDVAPHIRALAGFAEEGDSPRPMDHTQCTRCGRTLTAAMVAVLDGAPYGPDCIRHVDPFGDADHVALTDWLNQAPSAPSVVQADPSPVIFTSATLAAPDMRAFLREAGLPYALQMVAASPFDYAANALLYVPPAVAVAPAQNGEYKNFLVDEMARLVHAAQGGAFCLFTSYDNMRFVSDRLRHEFEQRGYPVFIQGQLPKLEIVKRFMAAGNGVLFATKSFWEGVSIDGAALRLVVIDKLPFEAPTPLNQAQEAVLKAWARAEGMTDKAADWYPFEALRVPRMIIDLKQGTGRLIRTQSDWGVIAILDARLRSAQYARRLVLPALPPAKLTCSVPEVAAFFDDRRDGVARTPLAALPVVDRMVAIATIDEMPF